MRHYADSASWGVTRCKLTLNSLGPIADISAQFAVNMNDDSGFIRVIITGTLFMALVQVMERG